MKNADGQSAGTSPAVNAENKEKRRFKWRYRGKQEDGTVWTFTGDGYAIDVAEALKTTEAEMRARYPKIKWMHGREVEGGGVLFGPTVRMLKGVFLAKTRLGTVGIEETK